MSTVTTHVLDTSLGQPAADVDVRLERLDGAAPRAGGPGPYRRRRPDQGLRA